MNATVKPGYYARVSSQRQADEKTIESQLKEIAQRIKDDGFLFEHAAAFRDEGFSGSELFRPDLERLRDQAATGLVNRLYVHSPDRLARNFAHQMLLLDELARQECEIVFLNMKDVPDSPEGHMLLHMQGVFAEYERAKILERTRRGLRHAAAVGSLSVFGGAPYGYRYIGKAEGNGQARWEIDPVRSEHVRMMFDFVGRQGYSLGAVIREFESRSILTKTGNAIWDRGTLRDMLGNPAYYGQARFGRKRLELRIPGKRAKRGDPRMPQRAKVCVPTDPSQQIVVTVPAIIDESLFHRVSEQLAENRKRHRRREEPSPYLLSGLTLCGQCGSAYCARRHGERVYYRCLGTDKRRHGSKVICDNESTKGSELEAVVWSELVKLLIDPSRMKAELERRQAEQRKQPDQEIQQLDLKVKRLRTRLDRLIDAYETSLIDRVEFESRVHPLRAQHQREEAALVSLRGDLAKSIDLTAAQNAFRQLASDVGSHLADADTTLKRQLLLLLVKQIEIHPDEIRIVYKVPQRPFVLAPGNPEKLHHCLASLA